ncbi:unnamed protein product [Macrosiphum euphorbiae]|uniref:Reverse transcriptase n=1 Tax=Macrosiphum euphorbiae TaxID=13131 RepID=A0AAV0XR34_9HEMI|nr:unnamed protein product [Macrosiphum euphorbiae]
MADGHHRGRANRAQRTPLKAITCEYNTTSTMALQVLAGVPTLELELLRIARVEGDRIAVRRGAMTVQEAEVRNTRHSNNLLNLWQSKWVASRKGRWTARWFPDVGRQVGRGWCRMDHFTSQLLTGHGDFKAKLNGFNLAGDSACPCGFPSGNAEHLLMDCQLANQEREKLKLAMRAAGADWPFELEFMTSSEVMFRALNEFAQKRHQIYDFQR